MYSLQNFFFSCFFFVEYFSFPPKMSSSPRRNPKAPRLGSLSPRIARGDSPGHADRLDNDAASPLKRVRTDGVNQNHNSPDIDKRASNSPVGRRDLQDEKITIPNLTHSHLRLIREELFKLGSNKYGSGRANLDQMVLDYYPLVLILKLFSIISNWIDHLGGHDEATYLPTPSSRVPRPLITDVVDYFLSRPCLSYRSCDRGFNWVLPRAWLRFYLM